MKDLRYFIKLFLAFAILHAGVVAVALATQDITGPALTSFSISPVSVDTSNGNQSVVVTMSITDGLSGFHHGSLYFNSPGYVQGISAGFNIGNLMSGNANNGTYAVTITWPQYSEIGVWTLNGVSINDVCGNYTSIPAGDARLAGYNTVTTY